VILYADTLTESIKLALDETNRRRNKQISWNKENKITPKSINKKIVDLMDTIKIDNNKNLEEDNNEKNLEGHNLKKYLTRLKKDMYQEAENLNFERAAEIRDEINKLEKKELDL